MNDTGLSSYQKLLYKRKLRAKKRIKSLVIIITIIIFACITLIFINNFTNTKTTKGFLSYNKKLNVNSLECPEYVSVQLIDNKNARSGVKLKEINNIVIHYTGNPNTTAQNNRDYFDKIDTDVCSHFVIGLDGEIIQCVPLNEKSQASNNRNFDTISIEVCHPDSSGKFNTDTYQSLIKLAAWLCNNSSLKAKDVIRHYDITGKECPKYYVNNQSAWDNLINDINSQLKNY